MEILSRNDDARDLTANNPNETLDAYETVEWFAEHGPTRLIKTDGPDPAEPATFRLEGHTDDNATLSTVRFDDPPTGERARLYLAAYLAAGGFSPPEDPSHFVPRQVALLPRRYQAAFLFGATGNAAVWVSAALSTTGNDHVEKREVSRDTVYTYLSQVRADHPDLWPDEE